MIYDALGLPRDGGATDMLDSCRLAGTMVVAGYDLDLSPYIKIEKREVLGVRHPTASPWDFSRDQLLPLVAGLKVQGRVDLALGLYRAALRRRCRAQNYMNSETLRPKKFPDGADLLTPSHMLVLARAAGVRNWFWESVGQAWLIADVLFNAGFTPTREPNQMICSLHVMGPRWLSFYKFVTPKWREALRKYWGGWRQEGAFAEDIIRSLEAVKALPNSRT